MPSTCKIELFKRYHSETPCKECPKQSAAYPGTPQRIPRRLYPECRSRSEQPRTISAGADTALSDRPRRNYSALCNPAPTDTDRNRPTNRADRISPERSRQTGAACHGQPAPDFSRLSGQGIAQPVHCSPYCHAKKCFLRFFCADFCELRLMLISCNS